LLSESRGAGTTRRAQEQDMRATKKYGYLWFTLAFFAISLAGHWVFAWLAHVAESHQQGDSPDIGVFLTQTTRDMFENWQSEFLQLIWQVAGLAYLFYVGSPQSREGDDRLEGKIDFLMSQTEEGRQRMVRLNRHYPRR
jgi:hypothetical protein